MNKRILAFTYLGLICLLSVVGCKAPYLGSYEASNEFPETGMVPNEATAIEVAFSLLKSIYGQAEMEKQKPFKARLDQGVWVVEGDFPNTPIMVGGSAFIGIRKKDGKVMFWGHTV